MFLSKIYAFLFRLWGWRIEGNYPYAIDKKIFVVAPHTSNWDFPVGVLVRGTVNDRIKFVGKKSLFIPPLGWIMRAMGGIPVDRSGRNSFVGSVVEIFNRTDRLAIALAPEGTRRKVEKFKTGYYYIAVQAGVPIIPTVFNWEKRAVLFMDPMYLTGNAEKELPQIENIFRGYKGRNPENSFS